MYHRHTKKGMLSNIPSDRTVARSRMAGANTLDYMDEECNRYLRYHETDVVTILADGVYVLNSGGWRTPTTKNRINEFQKVARIHQEKGVWYANAGGETHVFFDGMRFDKNGTLLNPEQEPDLTEIQILIKKINRYCNKIAKLDELPEPSSGDCLFCQGIAERMPHTEFGEFDGEGNLTLGINHSRCLLAHLDELYIHGSLIVYAMRQTGCSDFVIALNYNTSPERRKQYRGYAVNAVRRYLKSQLGVAN